MARKRKRSDGETTAPKMRTIKTSLLAPMEKGTKMTKPMAKEIRRKIEIMVRAAAYTAALGSRCMNHTLMFNMERGLQLPKVDQTFCRRNFARLWDHSQAKRKQVQPCEAAAHEAFKMGHDIQLAKVPWGWGFSTVLSYQALEYLTAAQNHVRTNFRKRLYGVIMRRLKLGWSTELQEKLQVLELKDFQQKNVLKQLTAVVVNALMDQPQTKEVYHEQVYELLNDILQEHDGDPRKKEMDFKLVARELADGITAIRHKFMANDDRAVAQVAACDDWYQLLPWLRQMLVDNHAYNQQREDNEQPARMFTLLPMCSTDARFVTLDTSVLQSLVKTLPNFAGEVTKESWADVIKPPLAGKTWARTVRTDGVTVDWLRKLPDDAPRGQADVEATSLEDFAKLVPPEVQDAVQDAVGVDPGRKDWLTANQSQQGPHTEVYQAPSRTRKKKKEKTKKFWKKKKKKKKEGKKKKRHGGWQKRRRHEKGERVYQMSTKEWRCRSGATRRQEQRELWLKNTRVQAAERGQPRTLYQVLKDTPPPKVHSAEAFLVHCAYIRRWLNPILDHTVGERKVRRLRFQAYMQRVATLDEACHGITGGKKDAIVVFGAARCSSGWGHAPAPIMELRRRLEMRATLVVLHEHYTSKRCSKCAFAVPDYDDELEAGARGKSGQQRAKTGLYSVRWCPKCKTRWNRDVNASRNIRLVFLAMVPHPHERPKPFKHTGALDGGRE